MKKRGRRPKTEIKRVERDGPKRVVAYFRVSTDKQDTAPQVTAVREMAKYKGWEIVAELTDYAESGSKRERPQLAEALRMVREGEADVLAVSTLDRLARSTHHVLSIAKDAKEQGWTLAIRDLDVDTSTPQGELLLTVLAAMADFERKLIIERTTLALAAKKKEGLKLGRSRIVDPEIEKWIRSEREAGATFAAITNTLNEDRVPSPTGKTWSTASVHMIATRKDRELQNA